MIEQVQSSLNTEGREEQDYQIQPLNEIPNFGQLGPQGEDTMLGTERSRLYPFQSQANFQSNAENSNIFLKGSFGQHLEESSPA